MSTSVSSRRQRRLIRPLPSHPFGNGWGYMPYYTSHPLQRVSEPVIGPRPLAPPGEQAADVEPSGRHLAQSSSDDSNGGHDINMANPNNSEPTDSDSEGIEYEYIPPQHPFVPMFPYPYAQREQYEMPSDFAPVPASVRSSRRISRRSQRGCSGNNDISDVDDETQPCKRVIDPLGRKGGIFAIVGDMYGSFIDILMEGVGRDPNVDPALYSTRQNELYRRYEILARYRPQILQDIKKAGEDGLTALELGRKNTRNSCIYAVGKMFANGGWTSTWSPPLPRLKSLRGFNHELCGYLLCPVDYDWSDPSVKEALRTGSSTHSAGPKDFPYLLWPEGGYNPANMMQNFLRNRFIVNAAIAVLIVVSSPAVLQDTQQPGQVR
ncbi:hypothetical protein BXZ70DRAFT_1010168 [Cristinia sonorae]|uniref:Uncharacterized protein n=1 Tax=Cristinia sonorae TaxID=1940300 RepID=A0A8K0XML9_9AGAR|nr:hypothetical protein BXZ70DRAFT_1010168 [Cristinia sonorae]